VAPSTRALACVPLLLLAACPSPAAVRCAEEPPPGCPYGLELRTVPAPAERAGSRFPPVDVAAVFGAWATGGRYLQSFQAEESGGVEGLFAESWSAPGESDIVFAALGRDGRATPAQRLSSGPAGVNHWLNIVAAPGGGFVVAWQRRGAVDWATLELAVVDAAGGVRPRSAGMTLTLDAPGYGRFTRAGDGFVYVYTRGTELEPPARRGTWAVWLDREGVVVAHRRILAPGRYGFVTGPEIAWDGSGVVVVVAVEQRLMYLRLGGPGEVLTPRTVIEASGDPRARYYVVHVVPALGGAWIAADKSTDAMAWEGPDVGHVLFVAPDGRHTAPLATGGAWHGPLSLVEASPARLRAAFRGSRETLARTFEVSCRAGPAASLPSAPAEPVPCAR
jgi:hypothetical protein